MRQQEKFGYRKYQGFCAVTLPYVPRDIQFLILLPDATNGLVALEASLTPYLFTRVAQQSEQEMVLYLPRFKLEPPMLPLGKELKTLGMKSAFDQPAGSANFDRIAPRRPEDYLYISEVFHESFIKLDEEGTEAAAATAVGMPAAVGIHEPVTPIEVKVDLPFLFAIQHRPSGACLFLGRVTDPR